MKSLNGAAVAAAWSALAAGGAAHAQEAVQWRVEDGGNGHWYGLSVQALQWSDARDWAVARGGHLATFNSAMEQDFVWASFSPQISPDPFFIGCYQEPDACEPGCGWRWVTDEPLIYSRWLPGAPNNNRVNGNEDAVCINGSNLWNDLAGSLPLRFITEFSADCNGDGIVDYGQCRDGSLPDYNGNSIPDCCEQGVPCEAGTYPVQWRVEDGGNGHWYYLLDAPLTTWESCRGTALSVGADLVSIASEHEYAIVSLVTESIAATLPNDLWLGGISPAGSAGTAGWQWSDGTPWTFVRWCPLTPNNSGTQTRYLVHFTVPDCWDDYLASDACCYMRGAVIEWSADCNGDGMVDYGQILDGTFADTNANGVPDCCDEGVDCDPCVGDVNFDGVVNGADISVLLGFWGLNGKPVAADINNDGQVDGADLAQMLGSWGECP